MTTPPLQAAATPLPIMLSSPAAPDADWETVRARSMALLATVASPAWTDHNVPDPGVTLLEAAAYGIADMHYRVEEAGFASWPLGWAGSLEAPDRHWAGSLPEPGTGRLTSLATALREALTVPGGSLAPQVAAATSRTDAESLLGAAPYASLIPASLRSAAISALRWSGLRRIAMEHTDVVTDSVAQGDASPGTLVQRDEIAARELVARTGVWPEEAQHLVERERRRQHAVIAATYEHTISVTTDAGYGALLGDMAAAGLDAAEAIAAAARPRQPVHIGPEDLERADGSSQVWPPHPLQALTCEPVTADDYARRARTHPEVSRAWTVTGRLKGVMWNGLPTVTPTEAAALYPADDPRRLWVQDSAAAALTIVVEPKVKGTTTDGTFLRKVLAFAVGTEVYTPFPRWADPLAPLDPRRLICDEVGIAPLRYAAVKVFATLVVPPTASQGAIKAAATSAIDDYFAIGRSETRPGEDTSDPLDGPWPPAPQPAVGWLPGEPVPLSEVVERLVGVPEVIAVRDLTLQIGSGAVASGANGALPVPAGHVPTRDPIGCFTTVLQVTGACDG